MPAMGGKERFVFLQLEYQASHDQVNKPDGTPNFARHSAIYIGHSKKEGPIKIEVSLINKKEYEVRYFDMTTALKDKGNKGTALKEILLQGTITLTNDEFLAKDGAGPVWDALIKDPVSLWVVEGAPLGGGKRLV